MNSRSLSSNIPTPKNRGIIHLPLERHSKSPTQSTLHNKKYNSWLKSRYKNKAKISYIFRPQEVQKRINLKTIFQNFDADGNGELEIEEFLDMFIQSFISKEYSSEIQKKVHEIEEIGNTDDNESNFEISKTKIDKSKMKIIKSLIEIDTFLKTRFQLYYNHITFKNSLNLNEFISLSCDGDASNYFKSTMIDLNQLLNSLGILPIRTIPQEFELMIDYLRYQSQRQQLIDSFDKDIMKDNIPKAFETLCDLMKQKPIASKPRYLSKMKEINFNRDKTLAMIKRSNSQVAYASIKVNEYGQKQDRVRNEVIENNQINNGAKVRLRLLKMADSKSGLKNTKKSISIDYDRQYSRGIIHKKDKSLYNDKEPSISLNKTTNHSRRKPINARNKMSSHTSLLLKHNSKKQHKLKKSTLSSTTSLQIIENKTPIRIRTSIYKTDFEDSNIRSTSINHIRNKNGGNKKLKSNIVQRSYSDIDGIKVEEKCRLKLDNLFFRTKSKVRKETSKLLKDIKEGHPKHKRSQVLHSYLKNKSSDSIKANRINQRMNTSNFKQKEKKRYFFDRQLVLKSLNKQSKDKSRKISNFYQLETDSQTNTHLKT